MNARSPAGHAVGMTTPARIPPPQPFARRPLPPAPPIADGAPATRSPASAAVERPATLELEPSKGRRNGYRTATWTLIVVLLVLCGAAAMFVSHVHEPTAAELAQVREAGRSAATERDEARAALMAATGERDALRAERDALAGERDALRARESELASAVAARDAQIGELTAMTESLREQLREEIAAGDVTVEERDGRIAVRLADQILFPAGRAELSARGQAVLRRVASSLRRMEDRSVQVEGHTDSTPIGGEAAERFATNWELSVARATHVVRFLAESCEVPGERLIASGFGEFRPVADNGTARGRRLNRRIELTLVRMPG